MAEKRQLEFFLLRYVPDAVKEEFVNIGLIMVEPGAGGSGFTDVRFTKDWRRLRCIDPEPDVEILEALEDEIRGQLLVLADREALLRKLQDSFSNLVQISPVKACLSEEPALEMSILARMYLESQHRAAEGIPSGRQRIVKVMRDAFDEAGILQLLVQQFAVEKYTSPGDPLKVDFGYSHKDEFKMFHAVSLRASVEHAVTLAYRFPKIAEGMLRKDGAAARLTAVFDDRLDIHNSDVSFALGVLEENRVQIALASEMPRIADAARLELRA